MKQVFKLDSSLIEIGLFVLFLNVIFQFETMAKGLPTDLALVLPINLSMAQILSCLAVMDPIDMSLEGILGGETYATDFASKTLGLRWR